MILQGTREVKVGLFVFIALVLLGVVIFSISDFYTSQSHNTYPVRVRFKFSNGIEPGAPVRLSGVKVGEVRTVQIYRQEASQLTVSELTIRVSKDAVIEEDTVAYVNTLGLIGEKYLELIPGTPGARLLSANDILVGKDSVPSEQLVEAGYEAVQKLEQAITSINAVVGDEVTRDALKNTMVNAQDAMGEVRYFFAQANDVLGRIRKGEGTVGQLLTRDDLYQDLEAFVEDLKAHPWKLFFRPKRR